MDNHELIKLNMIKSWRGYEAFMILIAALEGLMMIYGIATFDFQDLRRKLYFASYVFLFCCAIAAMISNRVCMKRKCISA